MLAGTGIVALAIAFRNGPDPIRVALLLVTGAFMGSADILASAIMGIYHYHPGLLPLPFDSYLGLILAEFIFVPAIFVSLYGTMGGGVIFVGTLTALDYLFRMAGLYSPGQWQTAYTGFGFAGFAIGAYWWAERFRQSGYGGWHRVLVVAAGSVYIWHFWGWISQALLRLCLFELPILADSEANRAISALLVEALPFVGLATVAILRAWALRPLHLTALVLAWALWFHLLALAGIWTDNGYWHPSAEALVLGLILFGLGRLDQWFLRQPIRVGARI